MHKYYLYYSSSGKMKSQCNIVAHIIHPHYRPDSPTLLLAIYAYASSHSAPNKYVSDVILADG